MKLKLFSSFFLISSFCFSQSNKDIANVYFKRATEAIQESIDYVLAKEYFEKGLKYTDTILDKNIAILGSDIYFETHHKQATLKEQLNYLNKSQYYISQYFNLTKNKSSTDEYIKCTEDFVLIQEKIEEINEKIKIKEKLDSLKNVWILKSKALEIKVDSIYNFNANNFAIFKKEKKYGLLNDLGEVIIPATDYLDAINFDGFFIFKDKIDEPTKIYCYDSKSKSGYILPSINDFFPLATNYGQIMLPRTNGRLVTYPNNTTQPFIYDLVQRKLVLISNEDDLLKELRKNDIIDKSNNDSEVKIDKEWYKFGNHLGGGIHPLYSLEGYILKGFLCSIDGSFLDYNLDYNYIGYIYNGNYEAIKNGKRFWINQNGTKLDEVKDEFLNYKGISKVVKLEEGTYQILKDGFIILGDEKLEKMADFIKNNRFN